MKFEVKFIVGLVNGGTFQKKSFDTLGISDFRIYFVSFSYSWSISEKYKRILSNLYVLFYMSLRVEEST